MIRTTTAIHLNDNGRHKLQFTEGKLSEGEIWFPRYNTDALRWIADIMVLNNIALRVKSVSRCDRPTVNGVEHINWKISYEDGT